MWDNFTSSGLNIPVTSQQLAKLKDLGLWDDGITDVGIAYLSGFLSEIPPDPKFLEFYESFPLTDAYGNFPYSRDIRSRYSDALLAFSEQAAAGKADELIAAARNYRLRLELNADGRSSPYRYMKGPVNFIRDKVYLNYKNPQQKDYSGENLLA